MLWALLATCLSQTWPFTSCYTWIFTDEAENTDANKKWCDGVVLACRSCLSYPFVSDCSSRGSSVNDYEVANGGRIGLASLK